MSRFLRSLGLFTRAAAPANTSHSAAAATTACARARAPTSEGDSSLPFHNSVLYKLDELKVDILQTQTSSKKWEISIPGKESTIKFKSKQDAVHFAIFQGWEFDLHKANK